MIYIMNSAVMPSGNFGTYHYLPINLDPEQLIKKLVLVLSGGQGPWESAIGYSQNSDLLKHWTGIDVPVNRIAVYFKDGDSALVMRLKSRVVDPHQKGGPVSSDLKDWEFAEVLFKETLE